MEYLAVGFRCLIGGIFLISSVSKVAGADRFNAFVSSVRGMGLLPHSLLRPVASLVVATEFAVWTLLTLPLPHLQVAGFLIAAVSLTSFAVGIAQTVRRGIRARCRCFGISSPPLGMRHVVRNAVLALVATAGAFFAMNHGPIDAAGAIVAVLAGLLLGGLIVVLDDVVDVFQPVTTARGTSRDR